MPNSGEFTRCCCCCDMELVLSLRCRSHSVLSLTIWTIHLVVQLTECLPSEKPVPCGIPPLNNFSRFDFLMPGSHRLIGGFETRPHSWPWTGQLVQVRRENGSFNVFHKCGCALIEPDFVVTAAHCFAKSRLPARYRVLLGGHEIFQGVTHRVANISIHPLYQIVHSAYDVALLRIHPKAEYSDSIWPICLPSLPATINGMCVVTGWGRVSRSQPRSRTLNEIHVPIMAPVTCNDWRHYAGRMHPPSMICAGYIGGHVDSCQGDSGGPLQCQNYKDVWELQGVVSWGIGCAHPHYPGVYTKMFVMAPWIRAEIIRIRALYPIRNDAILEQIELD